MIRIRRYNKNAITEHACDMMMFISVLSYFPAASYTAKSAVFGFLYGSI